LAQAILTQVATQLFRNFSSSCLDLVLLGLS